MKKIISGVIISALFFCTTAIAAENEKSDALYQYSTINALLLGLYDGNMTMDRLAQKGDMGIGTFNQLDGELVAVDGEIYQIRIDGKAYRVTGDVMTPFAVVTMFDADIKGAAPTGLAMKELIALINKMVVNKNHFQAIRIDGIFKKLKVRSVPAQSKPYKTLASVVKAQAIFEYENIAGTMVGFRTPEYVAGLNVPGYHFHFINNDRTLGGHVLALQTGSGITIAMDNMAELDMALPDRTDFANANLTGKREKELHKVEKGK